jgi:Domain of unknown function (DUF4332)
MSEFYRLVGEATTRSFTTLEPLAKHEAALRAIGVRHPKDRIALTETEAQRAALATDLSVPKRAIRQWSDIAGLAAVACAGPKPGDKREQYLLGQVALLLAANVDSVKALRHAMTGYPLLGLRRQAQGGSRRQRRAATQQVGPGGMVRVRHNATADSDVLASPLCGVTAASLAG